MSILCSLDAGDGGDNCVCE